MSKKSVFTTVLVSIIVSVLLSACSGDSRCPKGGTWLAGGANNPNGICVTAKNDDGSVKSFYAATLSESAKAAATSKAAEKNLTDGAKNMAKCYDKTGMGTSCLATEVAK